MVSGSMYKERLFLVGYEVDYSKQMFRNSVLLRVDNPNDDPTAWIYDAVNIPVFRENLFLSSCIFMSEINVYLFGTDLNSSSTIISRINSEEVEFLNVSNIEYYGVMGGKQGWYTSSNVSLTAVFPKAMSEFTLFFHPLLKQFYVLSLLPFENQITLYLSNDLIGPWKPSPFFSLPSPYNDTKQVFCYAPKAHPQFSSPNQITFSFNSDSFDFAMLLNEWVYTPQFYVATILE